MLEELETADKGERVKFSRFQNLKHVLHTGKNYMCGTNKFKEVMFYARPSMTNLKIPELSGESRAITYFKQDKSLVEFTNIDLVSHAEEFRQRELSSDEAHSPLVVSVSPGTPLGFFSLLGGIMHQKKLFVPGTFNLNTLISSCLLYTSPSPRDS